MNIWIRQSRLSQWVVAAVALPLASMPLSARAVGMEIRLCTANGAVRTLTIPVERKNDDNHCAKPCHACLNRKKTIKS